MHKNNSTVIKSSHSLIDEDKKAKDMEIDFPEKKLPIKPLSSKKNASFANMDTSYGENFSTANSVTEIEKKK